MTKCLILGGEGMLGHMLVKYMKSLKDFEVFFTSRNKLNFDSLYFDAYENSDYFDKIMREIKPDFVVNCIGVINKFVTDENKEEVTFINAVLPHKLERICKLNDSKLIHISTDCVFSGVSGGIDNPSGNYTEDSDVSPTDFYGLSKACGEVNDDHNLTIRTSIIGPEMKSQKTGLMEWFLNQKEEKIKGYTYAIWSGVTTLELAKQIVNLYERKVTGLINVVSEPISKFDLLGLMKEVYALDVKIEGDDSLRCDRSMKSVMDFKYSVPYHLTMLQELKKWGGKDV